MNKAIILTHGDFGQSLLNTTSKIIGECEEVKVVSNEHTSLKDLITKLEDVVKAWKKDDILIFVDFCGGSCWHAAQVVKRGKENIALLSAVNLPVLLAYINKRDSYKLPDLAEYLKECSGKGTTVVCGSASDTNMNHSPD